jgi:hypothetical protein
MARMSGVGKRERAALEAVARHFSATWEKGEAPPDAYLTIAGKRIAVEVTTTKLRIAERGGLTKPRLRFDRVALGFVRRLQAAPEDNIRTYLARQSAQGEAKHTIHGNQIRVRLVKGGSRRTTKVIGFVHNPDSDPDGLFDITLSLIERIGAKARTGAPARSAVDRWLVLAGDDRFSYIEPYRHVCSQLSIPTGFKKILVVLADGRIETMTG